MAGVDSVSLRKKASGQKVPRVNTPISEEEMAAAIIEAWRELFGSTPTKEQVSMVLAQNNLETGQRAKMWNYNVGNITHSPNDNFDYWEGLDWLYDYFKDSSGITQKQKKTVKLQYRAYPDLKAGVKDYLQLLSSKHYGDAWQHIINPDPDKFAQALKDKGYYTADESAYAAGVKRYFDLTNKSNSYDKARAGMTDQTNNTAPSNDTVPGNDAVEDTLDQYIKMLAASQKANKKLLKNALPNHDILIQIAAPDYTSAIEFSRVLCAALDEELLSKSYTHTDSKLVEVECSIPGPSEECFATVQQLSNAVAETFYDATIKIGGISIKTNCIMNKKSSYQPISLRSADTNYRKFLLKFV